MEVVSSDMPLELREYVLAVISRATYSVRVYKQAAEAVKKALDCLEEEGRWQCAVGHSFGSSVSHQLHHFLFATAGSLGVLLFKAPLLRGWDQGKAA